MKLFCIGQLLSRVEEHDYTLLLGVEITRIGAGRISLNHWNYRETGWIFEADESFLTWCAMAYGFEPIIISDFEFEILSVSGDIFLSKARTAEIRKQLESQLSLVMINS